MLINLCQLSLFRLKKGCLTSQAEIIPVEPEPGNAGGGRLKVRFGFAQGSPFYSES